MFKLLHTVLYVALSLSTTAICADTFFSDLLTSDHSSISARLTPRAPVKRTYKLTDNVVGKAFFDWFEWEGLGGEDPTHGRVNYLNFTEAKKKNIIYGDKSKFYLRADNVTTLDPLGALGRDSARIKSKKTFGKHVAIFEVRHLPAGCGTWPAIWEVDAAVWPNKGEIDIVEGVNDQAFNQVALHTSKGCKMPSKRTQLGKNGQLDCDVAINGNTGCLVNFPGQDSFGSAFNKNSGGWFVLERNEQDMRVWFWSRYNKAVPAEVKNAATTTVNPVNWGTPMTHHPNTNCDFNKYFGKLNIVINLTFCGDWAGGAYGSSKCPGTCLDRVNSNPEAFSEAYFDIRGIRIFQ